MQTPRKDLLRRWPLPSAVDARAVSNRVIWLMLVAACVASAPGVAKADLFETITICTPTNGTVSPTPGQHTYTHGLTVSIQATPNTCYRFVQWTATGGVSVANPTAASTTMTVTDEGTLCPTFAKITYTVNFCTPTGGTVSPTPGNHTYDCGSAPIPIQATPAACYRFKRWEMTAGIAVANSTAASTTMTVTGNGSICAVFEKIPYTVTICAPTGGTVNPAAGAHTYDCGAVVPVQGTPNTCYRFKRWVVTGGAAVANATAASTNMTVTGNGTLCPEFEKIPYTVSVCGATNGTVNPAPGNHTYDCGSTVPVQATPNTCYRFKQWTVSGGVTVANANAANTTMTVNGNGTLCPLFEKIPYTVTICTPNNGTVTPSPGPHTYDCGSSVSIVATPATCYKFKRWVATGGVTVANSTAANTTMTINGSGTLCAEFELITYTVTICTPTNGTVNPAPGARPYLCRATPAIQATPAACYRFKRWVVTAGVTVANSTAASTTMTVNGDGTLCAEFEKIPFTVTICTPANGTVSPAAGARTYDCGSTVPVQGTPAACYRFKQWTVSGGVTVANATAASTTMTVNGNGTLCPTFEKIPYTVTICTPTNGTVSPVAGARTYDCGSTVSVQGTPAACYRFKQWTVSGGVTVANATAASTNMTVNGNGTLCPTFEKIPYTVTICTPTGGTVNPAAGAHTYDCGSTVSVSATPAQYYQFKRWTTSGGVSVAGANAASTTMTVNGNGTLCPDFEYITYTVAILTPTDGTVNPAPGGQTYPCEQGPIPITATPAKSFQFKRWVVTGGVTVANPTAASTTMTLNGDGTIIAEFEKMAAVPARKMIAVLDVATNAGSTKRAVSFYDVSSLQMAEGKIFDQKPLFSVWTGYEDSVAKHFEDPGAIAVNPVNGTVYVLALDAGTPDSLNASVNDFDGDYDLFRIDYQRILKDFVESNRPRGTMYAPTFGPDYDGTFGIEVDHPSHPGTTVFVEDAIQKIGELARNQGTSAFDYDLDFVNPARLVLLDNEKSSDVDEAEMDHSFYACNRQCSCPRDQGGAQETWAATELGLVNLDFDEAGNPAGRSEPMDIRYYLDPMQAIEGLWVSESNADSDVVSFFEIMNWQGPDGNGYRSLALGHGPVFPTTLVLDNDPVLQPGSADGRLDSLGVTADGGLIFVESGSLDTPKTEPKVITRQVTNYSDAMSRIVFGRWAVAGPIGVTKDDDSTVTDGTFITYDKGEHLVYFFDADKGSLPNAMPDVYVFDVESGEMVYEELNAANHSLKRHGIELFLRGDIDQNGRVDANDVTSLTTLVDSGPDEVTSELYDLTGDRRLDQADVSELVEGILGSTLADIGMAAVEDTGSSQ